MDRFVSLWPSVQVYVIVKLLTAWAIDANDNVQCAQKFIWNECDDFIHFCQVASLFVWVEDVKTGVKVKRIGHLTAVILCNGVEGDREEEWVNALTVFTCYRTTQFGRLNVKNFTTSKRTHG